MFRKNTNRSVFVFVIGAGFAATAHGQWIQWPVSEDGSGHWYRLTAENPSWEANEAEAVAAGGHLVSIGSAAENDWILTTFGMPNMGLAIGLSQLPGSVEPDQGWFWANGEPVVYTNWRVCCPQEPNNQFHAGLPPEDVAYMHWPNHADAGTWYDAPSSMSRGVIERATKPNSPPTCVVSGSYTAECASDWTLVLLNGSGSSDPDDDPLGFLWSTDCPRGFFDDPSSATPVLTIDTADGCTTTCSVMLWVDDDNGGTSECSTTVTVEDRTPPVVTCAVVSLDDRYVAIEYTVEDECSGITGSAAIETRCCPLPVVDGQVVKVKCKDQEECKLDVDFEDGTFKIKTDEAALVVTATDECGNEASCRVEICVPD